MNDEKHPSEKEFSLACRQKFSKLRDEQETELLQGLRAVVV